MPVVPHTTGKWVPDNAAISDFTPAGRLKSITTSPRVDRAGNVEPIDLPPGPYRYPRLDQADRRIALIMGEGHGGNDDVYLLDLGSLNLTRFTFDNACIMPHWSPDGNSVLYLAVQPGGQAISALAASSRTMTAPGASQPSVMAASSSQTGSPPAVITSSVCIQERAGTLTATSPARSV